MFSKFLNNYIITSEGRVFKKSTGKELKTWKDKYGYECFTLTYEKYKKQNIFRHRLVLWINNIKPKENQVFVNHKDGNPLNNKVENLEWCTQQENEHHKYHTLQHRRLSLRKFTVEQVKNFRMLYKQGKSICSLAKENNCAYITMRDILKENTYNKEKDYI